MHQWNDRAPKCTHCSTFVDNFPQSMGEKAPADARNWNSFTLISVHRLYTYRLWIKCLHALCHPASTTMKKQSQQTAISNVLLVVSNFNVPHFRVALLFMTSCDSANSHSHRHVFLSPTLLPSPPIWFALAPATPTFRPSLPLHQSVYFTILSRNSVPYAPPSRRYFAYPTLSFILAPMFLLHDAFTVRFSNIK